jgi:anti-sigma factor RsiW
MRCSSCEPLLDAYLESALRPRQRAEVAQHVRSCSSCTGLLHELRVIDALLITASPAARVGADFTPSIVAAARETSPHRVRRLPFWIPLIAYLAMAWTLLAFAMVRSNGAASFAISIFASLERSASALTAAVRAIAPATPFAAASVTVVLLLDLLLLVALFYGYRRLRPVIALYLARGLHR